MLGEAFEVLDAHLESSSPAPLAVAFSGGGDSLALLLIARAWAEAHGRRLLVLTVDHGLNPQSGAWTDAARRAAGRLGLDFCALEWTGEKPSGGLPAAARRARHRLLALAAREAGARVILMGHTLDDVRESELMREEGSALGRLRAWSPAPVWPEGRDLFLLRPLLGARRAALRGLLSVAGLDWIDDPANDDLRFARSRARLALGGEGRVVTEGLAPQDAIRTIASAAEVDVFGVVRLARDVLVDAPAAAARSFLSIACVCAGGGERLPRGSATERLRLKVAAGERFTATLAGARMEALDGLVFMRDAGEADRRGLGPLALAPGAPVVWDGRFEVVAAAPDLKVQALSGSAHKLQRKARDRLRTAPAAARGALPAIVQSDKSVTCAILAEGSQAKAKSLVRERLFAACGLIRGEGELCAPDGEQDPGPLC